MDQRFTKPPLYMVYAPVGGFGNHIRWLCLLDSSYVLENLKGTTGPLISLSDKLEFISSTVYNNHRTYHNWLEYEFTWRTELNNYLKFSHDPIDFFDDLKSIAVKIDPELAYNSYVKLRPSLNGITRETFLHYTKKQNSMCDFIEHYRTPLVLSINSDILYQPTLDINLYDQILKHFNLKNYYNEAQQIHNLWYNLHIKAESEWLQNKTFTTPINLKGIENG